MKKIIFILLFTTSIFAQDLSTINSMVLSNSIEEVKLTSDKFASAAIEKFEYFKTANRTLRDEQFKVIVYTPITFTAEDKKEISAEEKEMCLIVVWRVTDKGFTFFEVNQKEQNLLPFWKATFSDTEKEYRINKDLKYKYVKNENSVSIVKSY